MLNTDTQLIDLDGAWPVNPLDMGRSMDCRSGGPKLRYCALTSIIHSVFEEIGGKVTPFTLYGSGDFHHLTAIWLSQITKPFVLISFDNHPDWDTRPPHWCCGTWMNRALESALLKKAVIWGCANFELNPPHRWFANHAALRAGRFGGLAWIERVCPSPRPPVAGITPRNFKEPYASFCARV